MKICFTLGILPLTMLVLDMNPISLPAQTYTVLHSFNRPSEGAVPAGSSLLLSSGTLYGTTQFGSSNYCGTVFSVNTTNGADFKVLHTFAKIIPEDSTGTNWDGGNSLSGLVSSGDTLYGTAYGGGTNANGTVFSVKTDGAEFTVLHTFGATDATVGGSNWDGANPLAGLVLSSNTLYGTASAGGPDGGGTIYSLKVDGADFAVLHTFTNGPDGVTPIAILVLSGNTLYGTAGENDYWDAGGYNYGTVFSLKTDGTGFTVLHTFRWTDGWDPNGLLLSGDTLYGTTWGGGVNRNGTVFSIKTNGDDYAELCSFSGGSDGGPLEAGVVLVGNTLYGTTVFGGNERDWGVIFCVKTDGTKFKVLHTFNGPDGAMPAGGLTLLGNMLYGTTQFGGGGDGVVFNLTIPLLGISSFSLAETNLVVNATNGVSDGVYTLLMNTNLATPLNQWTPMATNILCCDGDFTITGTNAVIPGAPQQYYILQKQ